MEKYLSVLLLEDEPTECRAIENYIDTIDDMRLVGVTSHAKKALEYAADCRPDAIILDLELHKGSGNGLAFLNALSALDLPIQPYVLVTTNNTSTVTYEQARQLGADFIMAKNQADYSAENVVEFLRSLKGALHSSARLRRGFVEALTTESHAQTQQRLHKRISREIELVGISPKAVGRNYLIDAIVLLYEKNTPNICAVLAKKYGKSDASVERAMQNAINSAWRKSDIEDLATHYTARISSERGTPTTTELIYYYAEKVKSEY